MKKLSISLDNDSDDVNYYILEAFPKLKGAGGYELLRASSSRRLELIPTPPDGYTAAYLKDVAQQAKIYIRPIQRNLPMETAAAGEVSTYVMAKCMNHGALLLPITAYSFSLPIRVLIDGLNVMAQTSLECFFFSFPSPLTYLLYVYPSSPHFGVEGVTLMNL